jgi:hypothetical protein
VQLKIVRKAAPFEAKVDAGNLSSESIHEATLKWIEETILSQDVITQNTPARIAARFFQNYTSDSWSGEKEHNPPHRY